MDAVLLLEVWFGAIIRIRILKVRSLTSSFDATRSDMLVAVPTSV